MNRIDTPRECSQRPAIGLGLILAAMLVCSQANALDHAGLDLLLRQVVHNQGVDYPALLSRQSQLDEYLAALAAVDPVTFSSWQDSEQMAYWINAYNAFTIKMMVKYYPVASIKDIKKGIPFVNTVWDIKFINIEGNVYDLNNIEHGIIRKYFDEPRIHFAVNCASVSCPKLLNRAFMADELESQLTAAAEGFLADPLRNNTAEGKVSSIFSWFKGDFTKKADSLIEFINRYAPNKIPSDTKLEFLDYDWRINESPS